MEPYFVMRREGIEPSRTNVLRILSPVRLPIPPSALVVVYPLHVAKGLGTLPY